MDASNFVNDLRKQGESDSDILAFYGERNPQAAEAIQGLLSHGESHRDVLDYVVERSKTRPQDTAEKPPETWGGMAARYGKAAQYGVASVASGLGKTAEAAGYTGTGQFLEGAGRKLAPADYETASDKFSLTSPSTWSYAPQALVESVPGMAADIAGIPVGAAIGGATGGPVGAAIGAVAGPTAIHTARSYGNALDDRMAGQGKRLSDASGSDQAIALGASAAEGALGAVGLRGLPLGGAAEAALARAGLGPALGTVTKGGGAQALAQIPAQIVGAGARDGIAGAAGNLVQQTGRTIGTERGLSIDPTEMANAGALSGFGGAAVRAARAPQDVYQSSRMRGLMDDPQSSTRVAEMLRAQDLDVSSPRGAHDAIRLTEGQLKRSTRTDDAKAFLKEADPDTRTAVADALDRMNRGHALNESQLSDIQARLGTDPRAAGLLQSVTDLHTLQQVKSLGDYGGGRFERQGLAGSAVGRLTNPFNKIGQGLGIGAGAAYAIPAIGQSAAVASALSAAPAVLGGAAAVQAGLRGTDALLGTRRPLDQFTRRFAGLEPSTPLPAAAIADTPAAQPQAVDPRRVASQTDRAWKQAQALQAAQEQAAARRASQEAAAWSTREPDPQAIEAQREAMWRGHEEAQARTAQDDAESIAGIRQGEEVLAQRLQAAQALRMAQEAQGRAQAAQQDAAAAQASTARQRDFDRAQAQLPPEISARLKASQEAAMWKAQAAQQAAPRDWSDADAQTAIRAALQARQAESNAALRQNAIERAAADPLPLPPEATPTAQPKAQAEPAAKAKKGKKAKEKEATADQAPEADTSTAKKGASDKPAGDSFTLDGIEHPIPDTVYNRAGYIKSIKRKQGQIDQYIRKAQDDGFISEQTDNAISELRGDLKTARSKAQARQTVSRIAKEASPTDRDHIMRTFDDDFYAIWSKDE